MTDELPIACSLDAGDLHQRMADIAALGRDALMGTVTGMSQAQLRFAPRRGIHERVAAIVAAEARCCAFLSMTVAEEPDAIVLSIDAPADAGRVLAELVEAFDRGRARRTARS